MDRCESKRSILRDILRHESVKNAVVFCNRKRDISILVKSLTAHGFSAVALHGDMTQSARLDALQRFKDGEAPLMIASDVAARGLDIAGLSHVFNFDVPNHAEDYVHRIGRTGRAGKIWPCLYHRRKQGRSQICRLDRDPDWQAHPSSQNH